MRVYQPVYQEAEAVLQESVSFKIFSKCYLAVTRGWNALNVFVI